MKKLIGIAAILLLIGAIAAPVIAWGPGRAGGRNMMDRKGGTPQYGTPYDHNQNLTAQQREQLDKLHRDFFDETAKLRNELWAKNNELNGVLSAENPDTAKAKALQKEISDLQAELDQKRVEFDLEERKINPDARYGRGVGGPMMSRGSGMAPGTWDRGGTYGPGTCWR